MTLEDQASPDEEDATLPPATAPASEAPPASDARTLRALAHPVRIALIEALVLGGAMTATQAGERIGETPTTCSFHLRQLAKYGFVEEAGGGRGRARPWRLTTIGFNVTPRGDPESELAANALLRLFRERQLARYRTWLQTGASYPRRWRAAANDTAYIFYLTVEELEQLNQDLSAMLLPLFRERIADPAKRPAGSVPVELLLFSYPIVYPEAGADSEGASR